jgi:hypothetical protein
VAILLGIAGILILVTLFVFTKRHEAALTSEAEAALPGPIGQRKRKRRLSR